VPILVTGCNGYIGKAFCKYYKEEGHKKDDKIIGVDIIGDSNPYVDNFVKGSFASEGVVAAVAALKPTTVYHFAAIASVPDSYNNPAKYYSNNVAETINLVNGLISTGWKGNFIFSSSAGVYSLKSSPVKETDTTIPIHPYGRSKKLAEDFISIVASEYPDVNFFTFRYFNVAGAYDDVGDHLESGHVIQKLCYAAKTKTTFTINGTDYTTKDGTCVRDYIHVKDVCKAHAQMQKYYEGLSIPESSPYAICNLGTTKGYTIKDIISTFERVTGEKLNIIEGERRLGDPEYLVADANKFLNIYTFIYESSELDRIIKTSWDYYTMKWNEKNGV
jgi:UDP-glucose 4-epimerase